MHSLRLALAGAAALLTQTSFAQTWQTVDDFQYAPGFDSEALAITKDPAGNLYAAGYATVDAHFNQDAMVMKSSDGGATWSVIDNFANPNTNVGIYEYNAITADAAGRLYGGGDDAGAVGSGTGGWFVRESLNAGLNWSTVDLFTLGGSSSARGVATDAAGNVYVAGSADHTNSWVSSWIVRKGTINGSGGISWATMDTFAPGGFGRAAGVFCHPTAGIFVVGVGSGGGKMGTSQQWYVRRSLNGGAAWANVDAYLGGSPAGSGADASGNLYVVGAGAPDRYGNSHWIVRKSSNNGTSWATVDDFLPGVRSADATGFAADASGNLFVVGTTRDWSNVYRWVVRENPGGVGSWQTKDTFQYGGGGQTVAYGAVADNSGNVFVAGSGLSNGYHWLVRKN